MKKLIFMLILVLGVGTAAIATSQGSWIGTDWVSSGTLIQSAPLKSNLDYLFNNKVHKPTDCTGEDYRLTWKDGDWVCEEYVIPTVPTTPANNCVFNGNTVDDGDSISAYETSSVPFGQTCNQQTRTCADGTLSGSFTNSSCTAGGPQSCTFGSGSVAHGGQVVGYETSSVPFGQTCNQQTRTCADGTLSGSFTNSSCVINPGASCTFAGANIPHGQDITGYQTSSIDAPNACISEARTCSNGTLSGSFTNSSCTVNASACSSQNLTFSYLVDINRGPGGENMKGTSCRVPASLVPSSDEGFTQSYEYGSECQDTGSTYNENDSNSVFSHIATCGSSGWELQSIDFTPQTCTDGGTVVGQTQFALAAQELREEDRCSCGAAFVGGQYGKNITCVDRPGGILR